MMGKPDVYVLCGGTFFTLMLQSTRQQAPKQLGKKNDFTEADVLRDLIKIANPDFEVKNADSFNKTVSLYQSCKVGKSKIIPITGIVIESAFNGRVKANPAEALIDMEKLITDYIDVGGECEKDKWFVRRLLELIENDSSIKEEQDFYIFGNTLSETKSAMRSREEFCLPTFLLGIWHYVVVNKTDNSIGEYTIKVWHRKPETPNTKAEFISRIGERITRPINLVSYSGTTADAFNAECTSTSDVGTNEFDDDTTAEHGEPYINEETADAKSAVTNQLIINGNVFNAKNQYFGNIENVFNN